MTVEFYIPGDPKGKQRPKFARRGKFTTTYTPKQTVEYEKKVRIAYNKANRGVVLEGPLALDIHTTFTVPKSTSKKKKQELLGTHHMKKPDVDNLAKIVLDPLNNLAFHDDGQISKLNIEKTYGEEAGVYVKLSELYHNGHPVTCPIYFF